MKPARVEIYDRERYFTVTGQVVPGYDTIVGAPDLDAFAAEHRTTPRVEVAALPSPLLTDLDDATVLARIEASSDGAALHRLYHAGETRPNRSGSENDFELACLLARHLGGDVPRIKAFMEASALDREKWSRRDYLDGTILAAIRRVGARVTDGSPAVAVAPLQRVSVAALAANPQLVTPPPMLLPSLVWRGRMSLFAGREKNGKTTYAAWAVAQAAHAGRSVLWLSADEDQATVAGRFVHFVEQGLGLTARAERDAVLDRICVLDRDPNGWEEVEALHAGGWRPDVYVIDTLSSFLMAVDGKVPENSEGELWQAKALRFKRWVKDTPSGLLLLAHANRGDGTYRGSTGIGAAPDAIITLFGEQKDPAVRRLARVGRFGIGNDERRVRYLGDEHPGFEDVDTASAVGGLEAKWTPRMRDALEALAILTHPVKRPEAHAVGVRMKDWKAQMIKSFEKDAIIPDARRVGKELDYIIETEDGRYKLGSKGVSEAVLRRWWPQFV